MKIWGFNDGAACGYYRVRMPFDVLASAGHEIGTSVGWSEECKDYPIILAQRISKVEALGYWRRLSANHKLIYEIDDDLWSIDSYNVSAMINHDAATMDAALEAIKISHMVIASTEPLAKILRQWHDNVVVIPNYVDPAIFEIERPRRDRVTVGWAGGDSHLRDMMMVAPHLKRFLARNPKVDFHNIGTDFITPLKLRGRTTGWSRDMLSYYRNVDFDIGIAPLADTVFNRSKSPIKAIEYAALGIPVIASDSEPYRDFVLDGVTGFLVRREHEWNKRLYELSNDEAMRTEMGAKAKEHARSMSIEVGWRRWEQALMELESK